MEDGLSTETTTLLGRDAGIGAAFKPRRLGHTNMRVGDLQQGIKFYCDVVGFELVYTKRAMTDVNKVVGAFFSNGNTYHDLAFFQRGTPGALDHTAIELSTEGDLLAGYERATAAGYSVKTADYDVARSLYFKDPDGNTVEIYADTTKDWRRLRGDGRTVSASPEDWTPGDPSRYTSHEAHNYPVDPELVRVPDSIFQTKRVLYAALASHDAAAMQEFYEKIVGLEAMTTGENLVVLGGSAGVPSLVLYQVDESQPTGHHHTGYEVWDVEAGRAKLAESAGDDVPVPLPQSDDTLVALTNPDGVLLTFFDSSHADAAGVTKMAEKLLKSS
jgi:catechol 2,3-dioxygenase